MKTKSKAGCIRVEAAKSLALAGGLLLLALGHSAEAQLIYSTTGGSITITSCSNATGAVIIPSTIDGLPVTAIASNAFENCTNLTSVAVPDSVINIGASAFANCVNLTGVAIGSGVTRIGEFPLGAVSGLSGFTIPNDVTNLGEGVFGFSALTNVTVLSGVTNLGNNAVYVHFARAGGNAANSVTIGDGAFSSCVRLTDLQIQNSVAGIGDGAFYFCTSLKGIHFMGNAPSVGHNAFAMVNATNYFLPGTTGWGATLGDLPTAPWTPSSPVILTSSVGFGAQNSGFGFTIAGADNASVVVQACTNLSNPAWTPLATRTLAGGVSSFSDPEWTADSPRFYRLAPP